MLFYALYLKGILKLHKTPNTKTFSYDIVQEFHHVSKFLFLKKILENLLKLGWKKTLQSPCKRILRGYKAKNLKVRKSYD